MSVDDPLLPAAIHLSGPFAGDVVAAAVERAGGTLLHHRRTQMHYRPGHDLVARFDAEVEWADGRRRREQISAATTTSGPPAGSLVVVADAADGELAVGVWRWPFDPALPALEGVVGSTATTLEGVGVVLGPGRPVVDVVAYRPMERAVVRVRSGATTWYAKVVPPAGASDIVERHRTMRERELPVPDVIAAVPDRGWLLLTELAGPTLRELIKSDRDTWIEPSTLAGLVRRIASVGDDHPRSFRSRLADAPHHAALLAAVLPDGPGRLARLQDHLAEHAARAQQRPSGFVHGDLHEAQLIVAEGRIVGLLDIDEAGRGDPVDDVAVPIAHLRHRALSASNGPRIDAFVDDFIAHIAGDHAPADVAAGTVAVLTGLATTPFRAQADGWPQRVEAVLQLAERSMRVE